MRNRSLLAVGAALAAMAMVGSVQLVAHRDPLAPIDPNEPGALAALAADVGLPFREPDLTVEPRRFDAPPYLAPFGAMIQAGDTYRIDVRPSYEDDAALVFVDGGDVLFRIDPFTPDNARTIAPLPALVRKRLIAGRSISWGYAQYRVKFWLVDSSRIRSAVAAMRRDRRLSLQSNAVLDLLEVQLLIAHDFHADAQRLATRLARGDAFELPASRAHLAARQAAGYSGAYLVHWIRRTEARRRRRVRAIADSARD